MTMSEQANQGIDHLLNPAPEQLQQERETGRQGFIPERWMQIEAAETQRMRSGMEQALQERMKNWKEGDVEQRQATVRRYFGDLMQPPSFEGGPYAAVRWLNLQEMLPRVIDIKQEGVVPYVDGRVPFSSLQLEKRSIIVRWLIDKVQAALPKDQTLTDTHINDCFTNVTEQQLSAVVDQIAKSGLALMPESPKEHWERIVAESENRRK